MVKNMSVTDGVIRIIVAIVLGILYYMGFITGTWAIIFGLVAVIFIVTGFINFCPLYAALGMRTRPKPKD